MSITGTKQEFKACIMATINNIKSVHFSDKDIDDYMRNFYRGAWLWIDEKTLLDRMNKKILLAGTGVNSEVIDILIRSGFINLTFADGDHFQNHNKVRQLTGDSTVGESKALSLLKHARNLNSRGNYNVIPHFLDEWALNKLLPYYDFVINSIDFDHPAYLSSHRLAKKHGVTELFPFVLGEKAVVMVNTKTSSDFVNYFKSNDHNCIKEKLIEFSIKTITGVINKKEGCYLRGKFEEYLKRKDHYSIDPQLSAGVKRLACLIYDILTMEQNGVKMKIFPEIYFE